MFVMLSRIKHLYDCDEILLGYLIKILGKGLDSYIYTYCIIPAGEW